MIKYHAVALDGPVAAFLPSSEEIAGQGAGGLLKRQVCNLGIPYGMPAN
jgi:hypothetical protein